MQGYYTYENTQDAATRKIRIAVVTQGVKLPGENRGYTRFRFISELLAREGFEVDLITSTFQHWDKAQRDTTRPSYQGLPYRIQFVYEPGYSRNLDLRRIRSHHIFARNLHKLLKSRFSDNERAYNLIYSEIPPNDMARACAEIAVKHHIPYIADINDLWPEAMRMAINIPALTNIAFAPFARDAKHTYKLLTAAVGTSDEYAARPAADRQAPYERRTVYVGNQIALFDKGAQEHITEIQKSKDEIWIIYAGTLGASYDIATLIDASIQVAAQDSRIRVKLLGDGPNRPALERRAKKLNAPVDFLGYVPYDLMAAYLCASDITINSLVKSASQSIVTKIGDYLAAGIPLINTGSNKEFCKKVMVDGFGINVEAEDSHALANAILSLINHPDQRIKMGQCARHIAEEQFDQERSYQNIVKLIQSLV